MKEVLCIIPAKGCSTRLKRKNLLELNGLPLVGLAVRKAIESNVFNKVVVSTEDKEIASVARKYDAEVPFLRSEVLSKDPSRIIDVVKDVCDQLAKVGEFYKIVVVLLPTSPLMYVEDIKMALEHFISSKKPSLMSVCETEYPPFNAWVVKSEVGEDTLAPCFPDSEYRYMKSTECPKTFRSNGAILILDFEVINSDQDYREQGVVPYIMPEIRSIDIDTELDFLLAQEIVKQKKIDLKKGMLI